MLHIYTSTRPPFLLGGGSEYETNPTVITGVFTYKYVLGSGPDPFFRTMRLTPSGNPKCHLLF